MTEVLSQTSPLNGGHPSDAALSVSDSDIDITFDINSQTPQKDLDNKTEDTRTGSDSG